MATSFSDQQLQGYLDESLPGEVMAAIENALRADATLRERLVRLVALREAGVHGLGEIWRRHRISCPAREELGSYLLGAIEDDRADYIRFHLDTVGCRACEANLADLLQQQREQPAEVLARRRKYFQTSAGYLDRPR
ncbi:MAG: hypothetical protein D6753_09225 [Planctomycetota bacterium]|nr:MAG: hypothetical protein D6753_09225 [Planctomycetota bacterium]